MESEQARGSDASATQKSVCHHSSVTGTSSIISAGKPFHLYGSIEKETIRTEKSRIKKGKRTGVNSTASETSNCSSFTPLSTGDCSKLCSTHALYSLSKHDSVLENSSRNNANQISTMTASQPIPSPPLLFKDNVFRSSTLETHRHHKKSPHSLATSLQNELAYLSSPRNSSETGLSRRNSLSLETFHMRPATNQSLENNNCLCTSKNTNSTAANLDRENLSESDISDTELPPLPPCTTLQATASAFTTRQISKDNYSDCSTIV